MPPTLYQTSRMLKLYRNLCHAFELEQKWKNRGMVQFGS